MAVALLMSLPMGFRLARDAAPICGVPDAVYLKQLDETDHYRA
jgi:hypothetical protein